MDKLALILSARVNDFVSGESNNKDCPTRFHVEARWKRDTSKSHKPKVDGILEYIFQASTLISFKYIAYSGYYFLIIVFSI